MLVWSVQDRTNFTLVLLIGCLHQSWKNDRIVSRKILHVKLITCDSLPVFGCILEFSLSAFCYKIQHDLWWIVKMIFACEAFLSWHIVISNLPLVEIYHGSHSNGIFFIWVLIFFKLLKSVEALTDITRMAKRLLGRF